jgi:uncharacterized protein (TIGR02453 family)
VRPVTDPPVRFRPEFFRFLRDLARNNNRPWFQAHKSAYETDVLAPCLAFVEALAPKVAAISPTLVGDPRPVGGSLMRIYRDVRFSKDKSPYRTSMGLHFFHTGSERHEGGLPGFFLHLAPGDSFVGAGMWMPAGPDLARIRQRIVNDPDGWKKARAVGLSDDENALKRVPPGFDPGHPWAADLKRKGFVASTPFEDSIVTGREFPNRFIAACKGLDPLNRFLAGAVGVEY